MVDEDSNVWEGRALPDGFSETVFQELGPALDADSDVDDVLPTLRENVAAINSGSQQFESSARLAGLDPQQAMVFDEQFDTEGESLDLTALGPNEVYINKYGSEALLAGSGSELSLALGPGMLTPVTVRGVVDGSYSKPAGTDVVLMASLSSAQQLLGRPGELSAVLNSNRGAVVGVGLVFVLVEAVSAIVSQTIEEFAFTPHLQPVSFQAALLAGGVLTFITVILSARRISRLNIVRAIRDLPERQLEGSRRRPLLRAAATIAFGVLVLVSAFQAAHLPFFGLGISVIALGVAMALRALGVSQRRVFTGVGLLLVIYWLAPHSFLKSLKPDFTEDMSGFFLVGTFPSIFQADARLASDSSGEFVDTTVTGVGDDFFATNRFGIALPSDQFTLNDVEGLLVENDYMDPVNITVRDLESGNTFWLATPPRL